KKTKIDDYDSTDFSQRVKAMDDVGLDLQLICQGAGLYADQLPTEQALKIMRESNRLLAERLAPHRDRLMGMTALSLKNIDASVHELDRTSSHGFSGGSALSHRGRRDGRRSAGDRSDLCEDFRFGLADLPARRRAG